MGESNTLISKDQRTTRFEWVDYAKGIAIILVVYRHILIGIERSGIEVSFWLKNANEIVYSFRMPLFFLLSGIFAAKSIAKRTSGDFLGFKLRTIMYPYFIWGIIQITIQIVLTNYTNSNRSWMDYVFLLVHPRAIDQLWYLYALFNVSIFFLLLYKVLKLNDYIITLLAIVCYGLSTYVKEYSLIHDTLYYLIFFVVGHLISKPILDPKRYEYYYSYKPFLILFPFFWLSQWYWLTHQDMNIYLFGITALLGTIFVFSLCFILAKNDLKPLRFLNTAGKYSLQIYLMHLLVVSAVRIAMVNIFGIKEPAIILLVGWSMGVVVPIVAYNILKRSPLKILFHPPF